MSKTRVRIVLEVESEEVPGFGSAEAAVRFTLSDALGEFRAHRLPVDQYVTQRYGFARSIAVRKVTEVEARVRLASLLRSALSADGAVEVRP